MISTLRVLRSSRLFLRALASVGILVFATTSARALPENLSTGLDGSDSLITIGNTPDAHWTVDQPSGGTAPARVVVPGDADWPGAWAADGPASAWIAIDASTANNAPVIPYKYYRRFTLTAAEVPLASISGTWGIDDSGEVRLNGFLLSSSPADYTATTPFSAAAGSGLFVAGTNVLTITMTASDNVWEAVRLEGALTVPEPSTCLLASVGCVLAGGWAARRKRLARSAG